MPGVWLASRAGTVRLRDGTGPDDAMVELGIEPHWFEKLEAQAFLLDPQVEVLVPEGKGGGTPPVSSAQKIIEGRDKQRDETADETMDLGLRVTAPPTDPKRSFEQDTSPAIEQPETHEKQGLLSRVVHGKRDR